MKINKLAIIFIIALITFSLTFYIYYIETKKQDNTINNSKDMVNKNKKINDSINNPNLGNDSLIATKINSPGGGGSGGGEGGSSGVGSDSPTTESPPKRALPGDIETKPCGFYTGDFGVCGGTCPEGECVAEERSCYCKIS